MIKNYFVLLLISFLIFPLGMISQEIQIFKVEDFDLKGKVKSCLVSTKYGKEEYEFNTDGLLTKSVTRYNDSDYETTYYKYLDEMLLEKRLENYRDNTFDETTSIAHFYEIDSLLNLKITEKIISYNKDFLDQYQYFYKNDSLFKIVHSNSDGIDETLVSYTDVKGEQTKTFAMNGVVQKSIRTSVVKENDSMVAKSILTKKFLEGEPLDAIEEIYNGRNELETKTNFTYSKRTKQFVPKKVETYTYDKETGVFFQKEIKTGKVSEVKEYVYQFDEKGNWIKEIITPDNTYKTRKIKYYEVPEDTSNKQ